MPVGRDVVSRGIIYWPYDGENKEIGDTIVIDISEAGSFEKGVFSLTIEDLDINTHYNYRSYANNGDHKYGEQDTARRWISGLTPKHPCTHS